MLQNYVVRRFLICDTERYQKNFLEVEGGGVRTEMIVSTLSFLL